MSFVLKLTLLSCLTKTYMRNFRACTESVFPVMNALPAVQRYANLLLLSQVWYATGIAWAGGVVKLRPAGRIWPAHQFNPTRQIPCTFFSSTTFSTVDSSATALAERADKTVWFYCYWCTTIHFNNVFLHRLRKSHCIRPSSGQAVANSALGSKSWPTLV